MSREQIAAALGVTPPRITQITKGPSAKAPEAPADPAPRVLVQRSIPTPPADRGSASLYLAEAERQGIRADRKMLYISRRPTFFKRETLDLDSGEWIVQVLRTSYSTEDTPVHALETICAATRHIFPIGRVAGADEL